MFNSDLSSKVVKVVIVINVTTFLTRYPSS